MTQAYPLQWPHGRNRTLAPDFSRFRVHPSTAYENMMEELDRLGARHVVVSSNVPLRPDGTPYRNGLAKQLKDPGVAVYFERKAQLVCLPCDSYCRPWENCRAIGVSVEALRLLERSGQGARRLLNQALEGFAALPPMAADQQLWKSVLGMDGLSGEEITVETIRDAYQGRCRTAGGATAALNLARDAGLISIGAA